MRQLLMMGVLVLGLVALGLVSGAMADGTFVWRNREQDIREPQQKAFILHHGGVQELVLSVKYEGATEDFGWLVPVPTRPEVAQVEGNIFEILSKTMQEPFVIGCDLEPQTAGAEALGIRATKHDVGIYDVFLLEGGDGAALDGWLERHGFLLPHGADSVLDHYARRSWTLAAIHLDPDLVGEREHARLADGTIPPLRFRFAAPSPVFPLTISSLGQGESEILIYALGAEPLVPAATPGVDWEVRLKPWARSKPYIPETYWVDPDFDREETVLLEPEPLYLRDVYGRFFRDSDSMWLTQSRTTMAPEHMEDLDLVPHDALRALRSPDERTRVEAMGYLATVGDQRTVQPIMEFLASRKIPRDDCDQYVADRRRWPWPGQDLRSALCALGELGDPVALDQLRRWAESGKALYQIDALEAMARIDPEAACEIAVSWLGRNRFVSRKSHCRYRLNDLAVRMVVREGGPRWAAEVAEMVDDRVEPSWLGKAIGGLSRADNDAAGDALAMAVACGDPEAKAFVVSRLHAEALTWMTGLADGDTIDGRGNLNGYPTALRPLTGFVTRSEHVFSTPAARASRGAMRRLQERPQVRDQVIRAVISSGQLSVLGEALMTAELSETTDEDLKTLRGLWRIARQNPRRVHVLDPPRKRGRRCARHTIHDIDADAVLHAAARLGFGAELMRWWPGLSWDEPHLKAQLLSALAANPHHGADEDALMAAATEYVRRVWNQRFRALDRGLCYPEREDSSTDWPYRGAFDDPYRTHAIESLFSHKRHRFAVRLVEDQTLDPGLRVFWLKRSWLWLNRRGSAGRFDRALTSIRQYLRDPRLLDLCARIEERAERSRARDAEAAARRLGTHRSHGTQ